MTIVKATPEDAGCYVDGHWGQFAVAHMIQRAEEFGYENSVVTDLAARHLASIGPSDEPGITDDEHEILSDASDDAENWLNENVAPEGHSFGWFEGEFYLWPIATWDEPYS